MKIYRCQYCNYSVTNNKATKGVKSAKYKMGHHYETVHKHLIPDHMSGYQYFYLILTGKDKGSCVICKSETDFNNTTMKYSRFCNNPACKQKYREEFKNRMIKRYGVIHLLNDPEKQKEMLLSRKISGEYLWSDKSARVGYTGSYELDFLKFLDIQLKWKSSDILSPSPHTYMYKYQDKDCFYIPDFFIPSLSLEVEIKDDGSAKNINQDSRNKDKIKDELMGTTQNYFNYIKIVNKNYKKFIELLKE